MPGRLEALWRYIDPARPDFVSKVRRLFLGTFVVLALIGCGAIAVVARTPFGRYMTGVVLVESGQPAQAEGRLRGIVDAQPARRWAPYAWLGRALQEQGKEEEAAALYADAARLFAGDHRAQAANCRFGLGHDRADEVAQSCEKLGTLLPNNSNALYLQARSLEAQGNIVGAKAVLRQIVAGCDDGSMRRGSCRSAESNLERLAAGPD